ncbi:hypothetical protein M0D70_03070 [Acinetobacter portensis]|uniref:DUF7944 domain-containing protein n=1 Tax=Acinetobacter portensis TaxID=1839785 RepID=A0ABY4JXN6_9GAMM|nr:MULTISPECIES: hypothetical protein [Acinetobacter]MCK7608429.1 hypothetical protein [Acinetobacter portensis]MCK7639156.1 hypothetical protein [Acinetobacter portensis]MDY6450533.1 hypothetical protein [Acinetobacter faecalis]MDY6509885.1 hypothetical protein [Acinetobacter faecalis]MDY6523238.1 hypothetical protein [Acinetobacter faecalis]
MQIFKALCCSLGLILFIAPNIYATTDLDTAENNSIIKEDVASAQIMLELCPAIIGQNATFDQKMKSLISEYLRDYSDSSMTLDKLQSDAEYKTLIQEARSTAKETSQAENKLACEEALNIEL